MKGKLNNKRNTEPVLDKLSGYYANNLEGDLNANLSELPLKRYKDEVENIFQLMEAKLRLTDAIYIKDSLEDFKQLHKDKWSLIYNHSDMIEKGDATSAASHQLIALIQLIEED